MQRREFITLIGAAAAWPFAARAQRASVPRVGYLFSFTEAESQDLWQACRQGLRELGYSEGTSIILEPRWAEGQYERLPNLVDELLHLKVDVNVTGLSLLTPDLSGKRLALLKEIVRKVSRIAILLNPDNAASAIFLAETQVAARQLGIELQTSDVRNPTENFIGNCTGSSAGVAPPGYSKN